MEDLVKRRQRRKNSYKNNRDVERSRYKKWYDKYGAEYSRKWHAANRVRDPVIYMLRNAKNRAKGLGVPFSLVRADIVIPTVCPVLGIAIAKSDRGFAPGSPSIDRFDNHVGYVAGNVQVISNRANKLKSDGTLAEFRQLIAYMEGR